MNNPRHTPLMEYVLIALISICAVSLLAYALWPVVDSIADSFKVINSVLAGAK